MSTFVYNYRYDVRFATRRVHSSPIPQPESDVNQNVGRRGHPRTIPCVKIPQDTRLSVVRSEER